MILTIFLVTRYRPSTENNFAEIVYLFSTGNVYLVFAVSSW